MGIRVLIVHERPEVRDRFVRLLASEGDITVVGEAGEYEEAIDALRRTRPDVLLSDINMAKGKDLEAIREYWQKNYPDANIIILADDEDDDDLYGLVRVGLMGQLSSQADADVVATTIRRVHEGKPSLPGGLMTRVLGEFRRLHRAASPPRSTTGTEPATDYDLTDRELDVLVEIVNGLTNVEIGEKLFISEKTVKNHVTNVLRKLQVTDRTQAAVYALHYGLVRLATSPGRHERSG